VLELGHKRQVVGRHHGRPRAVKPKRLQLQRPVVVDVVQVHDLGPGFWERNFNGTIQKLFMTEPLWGVGSTGPYGHDGRSMTLRDVILRHGGEAQAARDGFAALSETHKQRVLAALQSLVLFPPDDTASNLNAGDRSDPLFPQRGHGSIALTVLIPGTSNRGRMLPLAVSGLRPG
jgi:hypothetical protein